MISLIFRSWSKPLRIITTTVSMKFAVIGVVDFLVRNLPLASLRLKRLRLKNWPRKSCNYLDENTWLEMNFPYETRPVERVMKVSIAVGNIDVAFSN